MGRASTFSLEILQMIMKLQVMCDQASESPSSLLHNGEDTTPVIPMAHNFEDIDSLKANLNVDNKDQNDLANLLSKGDVDADDETKSEDGVLDLSSSMKLLNCDTDDQNVSFTIHPMNGAVSDCTDSDTACEGSLPLEGADWDDVLKKIPTKSEDSGSVSCPSYQNTSNDFPIDVSSSSSARFSRVLENISLPLLYIPTTKQLVSNKEKEPISHSDNSNDEDRISTGESGEHRDYLCNDHNEDIEPGSEVSGLHDYHESRRISKSHNSNSSLSGMERLQNVDNFSDIATRCDTYHLFADNTSLSSLSTCTDFSVSAYSVCEDNVENRSLSHVTEDAVFMDVNLHSRNSFDRSYDPLAIEDIQVSGKGKDSECAAPKKKSLKSIFGKKVKDDGTPGWKFFGKIPPKTAVRDPQEIKSEIEARRQKGSKEKPQVSSNQSRKGASEVLSTTALILENRPDNLPLKNPEEEERHKQQYIQMIEAAKKKEQKDLKLKKKRLQQQRKLEDKLMSFAQTWMTNVLPNWESMKQTKKVRELWWLGLPSNVRGQVWTLAIGNDLNITHELYEICHKRAEEKIKEAIQTQSENKSHPVQDSSASYDKEDSVNVIRLDVSRTFPHLGIFQKGGPYHDLLHSLLGAYACYRPDVGYVQGMSFIAAILLLNMEVADAFVCFANLLNRPCQLAFFRMDENIMSAYYKTFEAFFKDNLPKLHAHVLQHSMTPNLYLMEWVFLLYSKSLPLDVACRVWDLFCRDGEEFLFRAAIGILKLYENLLLKMDFIHMAQFLTKLPEDISSEDLFNELEGVRMSIDKRGFNSVHSFYKDLHESSL